MMECSHWPTPTQTLTPTKWVRNPFASVSVSVLVSVSASVNTPLVAFGHFLTCWKFLMSTIIQLFTDQSKVSALPAGCRGSSRSEEPH